MIEHHEGCRRSFRKKWAIDLLRSLKDKVMELHRYATHVLEQFPSAFCPEDEILIELRLGFTILTAQESQGAGLLLQADGSQGSSKRWSISTRKVCLEKGHICAALLPSSETGMLVKRQEWFVCRHLSPRIASIVSRSIAWVFQKPL
jgi:hypothetical protein